MDRFIKGMYLFMELLCVCVGTYHALNDDLALASFAWVLAGYNAIARLTLMGMEKKDQPCCE
jgi:hypothetical protein